MVRTHGDNRLRAKGTKVEKIRGRKNQGGRNQNDNLFYFLIILNI